MNKIIYNQLKRCQCVDTSNISESDTHLVFKILTSIPIVESKCYLLELDDSLLDVNKNATLVVNWNAGRVPANKWYKCEVSKKMSNMIKINGLSYDLVNNVDLNSMWTGCLPVELVKVIKEI